MAALTEQERTVKNLRRLAARYNRAVAHLAALEDDRAEAYLAARALDPPVTFKAIADAFGVTEAAVMQKIKRHGATAP